MSACDTCGAGLGDRARFCAECGSSVGDAVEVLGAAPASQIQTEIRSGVNRSRLYALVGLGVVGLLAWTLVSSPQGNDGRNSELADGDGPQGQSEDKPVEEDRPNGGVTTTWRGSSTSSSVVETSGAGDGPVLGQLVGLSVFVGTDPGNLKRIDLDTGTIDEFEIRAMPVFADTEWLVLADFNSGHLSAVRLDDIEGEQVSLGSGFYYGGGGVAAGPEPGQVWVIGEDYENPTWALRQMADGQVLKTVPAAFSFYGASPGPEISTSEAGGVFALDGDRYLRVAEGRPLATTDAAVLVQSCSAPAACQMEWLDRVSWDRVDLPLPADSIQYAWASPDGRLLGYYTPTGPVVLDLRTGQPLGGFVGDFEGGLAISPDGRYFATVSGALNIHDLDTGEVEFVNGFSSNGWGRAVFVQNR